MAGIKRKKKTAGNWKTGTSTKNATLAAVVSALKHLHNGENLRLKSSLNEYILLQFIWNFFR